ncbi:hypothetical protein AVEN_193399-1 [Araneus ventricosus]|uniref:Uncharacterized protein n=1 Tax=Araneus ventricosus TaxID=182803 RepID=A0A4Y2FC85_ARAVE|nr:hypothetical protein AVEN_193399-1 [Araneus ventricosus]
MEEGTRLRLGDLYSWRTNHREIIHQPLPWPLKFLRNLGEDDFLTDMDMELRGRLRDINLYTNGLVDAKRLFGKTVRDELSKFLDYMVNVIKKNYPIESISHVLN